MCPIPPGPTPRGSTLPGSEPLYVIHLYTALRDVSAAFELAAQIAEDLEDVPEVYHFSTTVGLEDDPESHQQVFVDQVVPRRRR